MTDLRTQARELIARLDSTGVVPGIPVGDPAPRFALPNALGHDVSLNERLAAGPVVVVFYRGSWCPFCNLHLKGLQDSLGELTARGASLMAISPQAPDDSLSFAEKLGVEFDLLSDLDQTVIRSWNLWFELPEAMHEAYRDMDMGLDVKNADGTWGLPVPATFVLDRQGIVRARHVDANYRERMAPEDVLTALDDLLQEADASTSYS